MRHPFDLSMSELEAIHAQMHPLSDADLEHVAGGRAVSTMATGEEGGDPTTMATGEEGGGGLTTMAIGEEGGDKR